MKKYKTVLSIAGSDSGGGAGIQADIKTISACGCFTTTAITAITVQNTLGVSNVFPIPGNILEEQIESVLSDIGADAIKIGMLHSSDIIRRVSKILSRYEVRNVVLDPVMLATSGDALLKNEAIDALKNDLIPKVRVITPNIPEVEVLSGSKIKSHADVLNCAKELANEYKVSVLLKAGHMNSSELIDVFYDFENQERLEMKSNKIDSVNTHGTGCTMSSAFAAFLARGYDLQSAALQAKRYINEAIKAGADYEIGQGHGAVKHFYKFWE
ncbi:bifunctional hydroxymethylpyrimidine kinase/phosphomethylpyrimidine kinase [Marinifilum sp. N1E240]|uniref:bifunctional hydroxymethylpyrimidine kinase/phosphomethylpyrimidine kinase n=1 Tax=Marinifilum sp. N1E240 TaxID=2608082 RepID=UPI00128CB2E2|nr:bifunctional hydroxymethylpyrimidine kinase/phosphomethylpyrimidine kinase [Marinifilum sp. N1E240]MPQ48880.1 bifunctional hydroxymethylpyrimidine kinase/phosphomethylpyrimidine kinase [Marinifilum sp. N1E240]